VAAVWLVRAEYARPLGSAETGAMAQRSMPQKYAPLAAYLAAQTTDQVTLTLPEFEQVIGDTLPRGAWTPTWWSNHRGLLHARVWLRSGWEVSECAVGARPPAVTFTRRSASTGSVRAPSHRSLAETTCQPCRDDRVGRNS
jgi:hypothetical protein